MPKLTTTQKTSILTVSLFLASIVLYGLLFEHISNLREKLSVARADYSTLTQQDERALALDTLVLETETLQEKLNSRFLSTENPIPFLDLVESLDQDIDVELTVESLVEEKVDDDVEKGNQKQTFVRAVFSVSGSWEGIYQLITLIDFLPYATVIEKAVIEQTDIDDAIRWEGQIHIRTGIRS